MRGLTLSLTAAVLALAAMGAAAQDAPAGPPDNSMPPASSPDNSMPPPAASAGSPDNPIPQSSPTASSDAYKLKAGDPTVISNPPVPDTPENRKAYGQPMSNGGRHTQPASN